MEDAIRSGEIPEELSWMLSMVAVMLRPDDREKIRGPHDIAALLIPEMGHLTQEQMRVVLLNTKNRVLGIKTVYQGTLDQSPIRIGEIFKTAILHNSAGIVAAHNHPSGDSTPSPEDVLLTRNMVEAGRILDIPVHDHLIIVRNGFTSLAEKRLGGFGKP